MHIIYNSELMAVYHFSTVCTFRTPTMVNCTSCHDFQDPAPLVTPQNDCNNGLLFSGRTALEHTNNIAGPSLINLIRSMGASLSLFVMYSCMLPVGDSEK